MPLIKSGTKSAISTNISEMVKAGHPHDQAVAAAMSTARKYGHQSGGKVVPNAPSHDDLIAKLLEDEETSKLYDRVRDWAFPPEALLWKKGIFPGTSADPIETEAKDVATQREGYRQGVNPWWSTQSFADGGEVDAEPEQPSFLSDMIGRVARAYSETPSWAERAGQQAQRDIAAYQAGGPKQMMADTGVGQELAGGFGGNIRAYHASPYDFAKFDLSKVGSGQGAQTFGHGFYFAENPEVMADYYKQFTSKIANYNSPEGIATHYMDLAGGERDRAARYLRGDISKTPEGSMLLIRNAGFSDPADWNEALRMLESKEPVGARRYQVNIGAEKEHLLDLDKRLAEQDPHVANILASKGYIPDRPVQLNLGKPRDIEYKGEPHQLVDGWVGDKSVFFTTNKNTGETTAMGHMQPGREVKYPSFDQAVQDAEANLGRNITGESLYRRLSAEPMEASWKLSEWGIPGSKYLDQGSRFSMKPMILNVGSANKPRYSVVDPKTGKQSQAVWDTQAEAQKEVDERMAKQTRNIVVFDPEKTPITIERKYDKGGEVMSIADTVRRYGGPPRYQMGGGAPWFARQEARNLSHEGGLAGSSMGRADKLPINVPTGAYVVPADIVSGFGQGNSQAGMAALGRMFSTGPLGMPTLKSGFGRGRAPKLMGMGHASRIGITKMPKGSSAGFAEGGGDERTENDDIGGTTPIAASHGEFIIHPQKVLEIGGGSLKRGHDILDQFIKIARKHHIKEQQKLPGPAKS